MIYYEWLISLTDDRVHKPKDYSHLLRELDLIDYRYRFILDENRDKAGQNLRSRYGYENGVDVIDIRTGHASILEVLIALSFNMADQTECEQSDMFWHMLINLGLDKFTDDMFDCHIVDRIVNDWIDGDFEQNGSGSPFPLHEYHGDATHLDLFSLMNAYIYEKFHERWIPS